MKRFSAAVVCVVVLAGVLVAQQPDNAATREDVQKLFEVMNAKQQTMTLLSSMKQQMQAMMPQVMEKQIPNATPEEKAKMQEFMDRLYQKMFENMPIGEMMDATIPAYQHHLTHNEMEQLIQFYSSPIGQKLLTQMPAIVSEGLQLEMPLIQKWVSDQMSEVEKSTAEFARSLRNTKQKAATPKQKS